MSKSKYALRFMQICVTTSQKKKLKVFHLKGFKSGIVAVLNSSKVFPLLCLKDQYVQLYLGVMSVEIDKRGKELYICICLCVCMCMFFSSFFFSLYTNHCLTLKEKGGEEGH